MLINGIALFIALGVVGLVIYWLIEGQRAKRPTDADLAEWLGFLVKDKDERPERIPRITMAELKTTVYDAVEKFMNPKLEAEFKEKTLKLRNEIAARAIQVELYARKLASGKTMTAQDEAVMIREGLKVDPTRKEANGNGRKERESDPAFSDAEDHRTFDDVRDGKLDGS